MRRQRWWHGWEFTLFVYGIFNWLWAGLKVTDLQRLACLGAACFCATMAFVSFVRYHEPAARARRGP